MYQRGILSLLAVMASVISRALTYSTGAPAEGCWSERPLHRDYLPQGGYQLPFRISTNATTYGPRETIVVTLDSPKGIQHKGFLIRIVTSGGLRGGRWAVDRSIQRYNPECGVTHKDSHPRDATVVLWRAPDALRGDLGNIQFKAVVVANLTHFWDNVLSHSLRPVYPDANKSTLRRFQKMFSLLDPDNSTDSSSATTSSAASSPPNSAHARTSSRDQAPKSSSPSSHSSELTRNASANLRESSARQP